jgi:hypothetical protein
MVEPHEIDPPTNSIAEFASRIERLQLEGAWDRWRGEKVPWSEAPEQLKLRAITREAFYVSVAGPPVPGTVILDAVERNVDYERLPAWQREMLQDVRANVDAGQRMRKDETLTMDRAWLAVDRDASAEHFDRCLEKYKADGLYDRPQNTPWLAVPEAKKMSAIVGLAQQEGPSGAHALAAIEREVKYDQLPPWRRDALEGLRARLDAGELAGEQPREVRDRANYALRLIEFEARVEDHKHFGGEYGWGTGRRPWEEFDEMEKLDRIVWAAGDLHLHFEPREYEIIDREVDLSRVPDGRRRGIEASREMTRLGPEEYERRREAKYAPPNEAAAAFKERIEDGLWKTCFTDGEIIFADFWNLSAEAKLHHLARIMDWEQVPESYFLTMLARELDIKDLPEEKQFALQSPKVHRSVLSRGFEEEFDAPAADTSPRPEAIRDTTRNLVEAIWLDAWPRAGAIVDFGLNSQEHYEALYYPVREGEITPEQLDGALGKGGQLTALARSARSNPHREIAFRTSWDELLSEPDNQPAPGDFSHHNVPGRAAEPAHSPTERTARTRTPAQAPSPSPARGLDFDIDQER